MMMPIAPPLPTRACLVIDPDESSRRALVSLLRSLGGQPEVACEVAEACGMMRLAAVNSSPYRVICVAAQLADVGVPKLVTRLRETDDALRIPAGRRTVVLVTALPQLRLNIVASFRAGCEGWLAVPVNRDRLGRVLDREGVLSEWFTGSPKPLPKWAMQTAMSRKSE